MEQIDFRMSMKHLYSAPKMQPVIAEVPKMNFLMIEGKGDPNIALSFQQGIDALFSLSYTLKFMVKKGPQAVDFKVMPLEGLWWADDMSSFASGEKSSWKWTIMIMQPEFISQEMVMEAADQVKQKKHLPALELARLESFEEGLSAQVMHIGPFSQEGPAIEMLHQFIEASGYTRRGRHHEIYLSDTRRAAPEKWKTVIRQPVKK